MPDETPIKSKSEDVRLARVDDAFQGIRVFGVFVPFFNGKDRAAEKVADINSAVSRLVEDAEKRGFQDAKELYLAEMEHKVEEAEKDAAVKALERAAFDGCRFCQRVKEDRAAPVELRDGTYYHAGAICQSDSIRAIADRVRKGEEKI